MYQIIVLGLGFLLLIGGGWLIKSIDKEGVVSRSFSGDQVSDVASFTLENVSGSYVCDAASGCKTEYRMSLLPSGESELITTYGNGAEVSVEKGTWRFENGGMVSILMTESQVLRYEKPRTFLVQLVGESKLSRLSFDKKIYSDMKKPVFIKKTEEGQ